MDSITATTPSAPRRIWCGTRLRRAVFWLTILAVLAAVLVVAQITGDAMDAECEAVHRKGPRWQRKAKVALRKLRWSINYPWLGRTIPASFDMDFGTTSSMLGKRDAETIQSEVFNDIVHLRKELQKHKVAMTQNVKSIQQNYEHAVLAVRLATENYYTDSSLESIVLIVACNGVVLVMLGLGLWMLKVRVGIAMLRKLFAPRRHLASRENEDTQQDDGWKKPPPLGRDLGLWLPTVLRVSDVEFISSSGLDAFVLYRLSLLGLRFCLAGLVFAVPLLFVYGWHEPVKKDLGGINRFSVANVAEGSDILWLPVISIYYFIAVACRLLWAEEIAFRAAVRRYLLGLCRQRHRLAEALRTVLVEDLPPTLRQEAALKAHFEALFGTSTVERVSIQTPEVEVDDDDEDSDFCEDDEKAKQRRTLHAPCTRDLLLLDAAEEQEGLRAAIPYRDLHIGEWWHWLLKGLGSLWRGTRNVLLSCWRALRSICGPRLNRCPSTGDVEGPLPKRSSGSFVEYCSYVGLVTFSNNATHTAAVQMVLTDDLQVSPGPLPSDIVQSNLGRDRQVILWRTAAVDAALTAGLLLWSVPVSLIQALASVRILQLYMPLPFLAENSKVYAMLTEYLPVMAWLALLDGVNGIFWKIALHYEGVKTYSEIQLRTMRRFWLYTLCTLYITVLSGSILGSLGGFLDHPRELVLFLGRSVPRVSVYFLSVLLSKAMLTMPVSFLRLDALLAWARRRVWEGREALKEDETPWATREEDCYVAVDYGKEVCDLLFAYTISFFYATLSPALLLASSLYFLVALVFYRFGGLYSWRPGFQSQGSFFVFFLSEAASMLPIGVVLLLGALLLLKAYMPALALVPLGCGTLAFRNWMLSRLEVNSRLPLKVAQELDKQMAEGVRSSSPQHHNSAGKRTSEAAQSSSSTLQQ